MNAAIPCTVTVIDSAGQPGRTYDMPSQREAIRTARGLCGSLLIGGGGTVEVYRADVAYDAQPVWEYCEVQS